MFRYKSQFLILLLFILFSTNSLGLSLSNRIFELQSQTIVPFYFNSIESGNLVFGSFLYSQVLPENINKKHFDNIYSDEQSGLLCGEEPLLLSMGDSDPPRKPSFNSEYCDQLQSMNLKDLLNLILWLLEQINLGNLQAQNCVIELLHSLSTQITSGQGGSQHFQQYLSLFINMIFQNRTLFELVRVWLNA